MAVKIEFYRIQIFHHSVANSENNHQLSARNDDYGLKLFKLCYFFHFNIFFINIYIINEAVFVIANINNKI